MGINIGIGNYIGKGKAQGNSFHPSLVDYWNFAGKKNSDTDRATIKGIKGNILNACNFGWSLGSGYGLYKTNFLQWNYISSRGTAVVTSDTIHLTETFGNAAFIELGNLAYNSENITVDITGDFGNVYLMYDYYASETEIGTISIKIPGRYELPKSAKINSGFRTNKAAKLDLTIEQIPEYEGAIVTDGVDDYLKLDKVGYNIGTVILKYIPLFRDNNWRYVFDVTEERCYFASSKDSGVFVTSMQYKSVGDYTYLIPRTGNNPTVSNTPLYISSHAAMKEFLSMALFEMAIYSEILTDEEIQKEIDKMNKL